MNNTNLHTPNKPYKVHFFLSIKRIGILLTCICTTSLINAQEPSTHVWKDRLLIVMTTTKESTEFLQQMRSLERDSMGIKARKLIIYQSTPEQYKKGLQKNSAWRSGSDLYSKYNKENSAFKIVLIGLDGIIKLRETQVLSVEKLFTLIDGMPMRKAELRNGK